MTTDTFIIIVRALVVVSTSFVLVTAVLSSLEIAVGRRRVRHGPEQTAANNPAPTSSNTIELEAKVRNQLAQREQVITRLSLENLRLSELARQQASIIASLSETRSACSGHEDAGRFRRLRALILKELHPDGAPSNRMERVIRAEIFKVVWPKVEAISGAA